MVKVTYKKSAKKGAKTYTKNLSFKATVKTPSITLNQSSVTLNVGETAPVKVTKKTPSSLVVKYTSEDPAIASVAKGTITAISAGTTNIVVTATYGKKTVTKKVKVTVNVAKDGLTTKVTNPFSSDYADTVLVNDAAIVNVTYAKDGKPIAGQTVVLSLLNNNNGSTGAWSNYRVNGLSDTMTATTNASGVATFTVNNWIQGVKASDTTQVASVKYKAQLPTEEVVAEGTVNFAAITNSDVTNVNNHNAITTDDLVPSTNYSDTSRKGLAKTTSMDQADPTKTINAQLKNVEFVESQQVSSNGGKEHEVIMTGGYPKIYLPGSSTVADNASKMTDSINYTSGEYHVYGQMKNANPYYYELKEDPNKLTYATLNFDKVTLSKYTRIVVETFKDKAAAEKSKNPGEANNGSIDQKIYNGEMSQSSFGYQIPLGSGYAKLCVKVTIQSAGQVDLNKNDGYTVKDVVYVYKTQTTSGTTSVALKNATVDWSIAATPYTAETSLSSCAGITTTNGEYLTQKLPVFPYTGTAVITKYDLNGKVVAYYAVATCNNCNNQNVIDPDAIAYQISADELRDKVGEITSQDGSSVTVNSYQSGRMTLEGVVKVNGKVLENAELANVYTSVQWNPVPKTETTNAEAFVALLGQKIEVVAQLTDKNGNAVSESGHGINFKDSKKTYATSDTEVTGEIGKATIVNTLTNKTDANGQAKMILKASEVAELLNIKAESADSKYDAKLIIAGKSADSADLYWIDANLSFIDKVQDGGQKVETTTTSPAITTSAKNLDIQPSAGTTWEYGIQTVGTTIKKGKLAGKSVTITGLGITMAKSSASVGTVETIADVKGAVKATSTKGGKMDIAGKIDSSTLTKDVTVSDGTFAGTGSTSINKKLTINVVWKAAGLTASYVNPTGTRTTAGSKDVYLKVTDSYGNAVSGQAVTFKVDGDATLAATKATTDVNGIAKTKVTKGTTATSTVSATVDGISTDTFDQTYVWVNSADVTALAISKDKDQVNDTYLTAYDKDKKTITLTFNDDVVASSVVKDMFTVEYKVKGDTNGTNTNTLVVKSVAVDNNVVTLTLSDVPSLVDAKDVIDVTIARDKNVGGVGYTLTSVAGSSYGKSKVTIKLDGVTAPSEA